MFYDIENLLRHNLSKKTIYVNKKRRLYEKIMHIQRLGKNVFISKNKRCCVNVFNLIIHPH